MMNRIDTTFRRLREGGRPSFVAYLTAGDPKLTLTQRLVEMMSRVGCDVIELGVPFSDPIADGLVNQRAAQRALASGTTLKKILACATALRKRVQTPLVLFSYFNPIHAMGITRFAEEAKKAGIDGVLILDLPPEEAPEVHRTLRRHNLKIILLIAPTSSDQRIRIICNSASGFLYCVSRTGVTGAQKSRLAEVRQMVRRVKRHTRLPVVVGFGISSPKDVSTIGEIADGVVVGSAIVSEIEKHRTNPVPSVTRLISRLTRRRKNRRA